MSDSLFSTVTGRYDRPRYVKCFVPFRRYRVPVFVMVGTGLLNDDRHGANIYPDPRMSISPPIPIRPNTMHLHANRADLVDLKIKRSP